MKIIPQQTKAGTQILGVDLSKPLPAADIEAIRNAFVESGVVVFKEQKFTPEQLLAFSRRFGELENYESTIAEFLMPGYPDIVVISNIVENGKRPAFAAPGSTGTPTVRTWRRPPGPRFCTESRYRETRPARRWATPCSRT